MASELLVRRAVEADLPTVGRVTVAAYADYTRGPGDPYVDKLADATSRFEDAELWVAVDAADEVIGTVTLCPPGSPWREIALPGEGEFRMLAVDPRAQGRGVGAALLRLVLREYAGQPVALCSLDEMHPAHRLYERWGFQRLPERDWHPLPGVNLWAFIRPVSSAAP